MGHRAIVFINTKFKCTGAAAEVAQTATTSETTVVLEADFYRAGDANDESFTAKIIVTAGDLPDTRARPFLDRRCRMRAAPS